MHFWIDKRSQACSFSGRYCNPSRHRGGRLWIGAGTGACKIGSGVMVTPVHRFQPIESAQAGCGIRRQLRQQRFQGASLLQNNASVSPRLDNSIENHGSEIMGRNGGGMSLLPQSAGPCVTPQQVLLRLPAPREDNIALGKIKCGLWASLTLIASFLMAAKFYADYKGVGLEVVYVVTCAFLLILLLACCVISLCGSTSSRTCLNVRPVRQTTTSQHSPGPHSALIEGGASEGTTASHSHTWSENSRSHETIIEHEPETSNDPPPYHIAIWLPHPEPSSDNSHLHILPPSEAPPPSYDKAVS